jgi:hypothetical protein
MRVVAELYIDGPEVDANFAIVDGEVLFCNILDDFPGAGDYSYGATSAPAANLMETLMDVLTNFLIKKQELTKSSLMGSIACLGFKYGIFHGEARVSNSCARCEQRLDGILDMSVSNCAEATQLLLCYLHEVNA